MGECHLYRFPPLAALLLSFTDGQWQEGEEWVGGSWLKGCLTERVSKYHRLFILILQRSTAQRRKVGKTAGWLIDGDRWLGEEGLILFPPCSYRLSCLQKRGSKVLSACLRTRLWWSCLFYLLFGFVWHDHFLLRIRLPRLLYLRFQLSKPSLSLGHFSLILVGLIFLLLAKMLSPLPIFFPYRLAHYVFPL